MAGEEPQLEAQGKPCHSGVAAPADSTAVWMASFVLPFEARDLDPAFAGLFLR